MNACYSSRVLQYFQPAKVRNNTVADNLDAFLECTKASSCEWDLLVTDTERAKFDAFHIAQFMRNRPKCTVAVLRLRDETSSPLPNTVFQADHTNIEDWLPMMHSLLP
jgi:hypothetical protein